MAAPRCGADVLWQCHMDLLITSCGAPFHKSFVKRADHVVRVAFGQDGACSCGLCVHSRQSPFGVAVLRSRSAFVLDLADGSAVTPVPATARPFKCNASTPFKAQFRHTYKVPPKSSEDPPVLRDLRTNLGIAMDPIKVLPLAASGERKSAKQHHDRTRRGAMALASPAGVVRSFSMVSLTTSRSGEMSLPVRLSRGVQNLSSLLRGIAACFCVVLVCCDFCWRCGVAAASEVEPLLPSSLLLLLLLWEWAPYRRYCC